MGGRTPRSCPPFSFIQILEQVRGNRITVISGSTGCGKSSHIPLFLMDEMMSDPSTAGRCNILVAMPRRIAATSLCQYVCDLRRYRPGAEIGYQVCVSGEAILSVCSNRSRFSLTVFVCGCQVGMASAVRSKKTRILYTTTGVFVQKLCQETSRKPSEDCLSRYSHIILDEV